MTFELIYADPPWKWTNEKTGGSHTSGASQKYPVMDLAAIQQLAVPAVCSYQAVLALWCPTRLKFSHGGPTLAAWGFSYETTVYWNKDRLGMGFWFRGQVEELLIGTRGDVAPFRCQEPNIRTLPAGEHSQKPEEFRAMLERATKQFSSRKCLEIFARRDVAGWTGIGNHVTGHDVRTDLRRLAQFQKGE